jgi:drug/metabolite transporter (DMT)-like permease
MLAVLLALGSAIAYGTSDFLAGWLSRRIDYARVGAISQLAAAGGCLLASAIMGGRPSAGALWWGAFSGLGGGLGTLALYRGLARGRISVVAPLSGVLAAGLPALFGLGLGERPSAPAAVGLALALPAVWLVSSAEGQDAGRQTGDTRNTDARSILDGVLAGVGFAVLFIGLQRAGQGSGLWPTSSSQLVSAVAILGFYFWRSTREKVAEPLEPSWRVRLVGPLVTGGLVGFAVTFYFLATHFGLLSVVAVLTSLYPAITIALARWLLAERIHPRQGAGLALAGVSVALISAS